MTEQQVLDLAIKIYQDLPFWKRWRISKYYRKNGWDVTGEWGKCWGAAYNMIMAAEAWNKKQTSPAKKQI